MSLPPSPFLSLHTRSRPALCDTPALAIVATPETRPVHATADALNLLFGTADGGFSEAIGAETLRLLVAGVEHEPAGRFATLADLLSRTLGISIPELDPAQRQDVRRRLAARPPEACSTAELIALLKRAGRFPQSFDLSPSSRQLWQAAFCLALARENRAAASVAPSPGRPQAVRALTYGPPLSPREMQRKIVESPLLLELRHQPHALAALVRSAFGGPVCQHHPAYRALCETLGATGISPEVAERAVSDVLIDALVDAISSHTDARAPLAQYFCELGKFERDGAMTTGKYRSGVVSMVDKISEALQWRPLPAVHALLRQALVPLGLAADTGHLPDPLDAQAPALAHRWCRMLLAPPSEAAAGDLPDIATGSVLPTEAHQQLINAAVNGASPEVPHRLAACWLELRQLFAYCLDACGITGPQREQWVQRVAGDIGKTAAALVVALKAGADPR